MLCKWFFMAKKTLSILCIAFSLFLTLYKAETPQKHGFYNGESGYLYNIGTSSYLTKIKVENNRITWIKGTEYPEKAALLRIEHVFYKGASYNLIMLEDTSGVYGKYREESLSAYNAPFFGIPVFSLINTESEKFIGISTDTSLPRTWITFSPPIFKKSNAFKIYLGNRCMSIKEAGYLVLEKCVVAPESERNNQLFIWLPEDKYVAKNNIPVLAESIESKQRNPKKEEYGNQLESPIKPKNRNSSSSIYRSIGETKRSILNEEKEYADSIFSKKGKKKFSSTKQKKKSYQILPPGF